MAMEESKPLFSSVASGLLVAIACLWPLGAAADPVTITTIGPNGLSQVVVGNFGEPNAATVGQTFIAPARGQLQSFTFYLFPIEGGPARFKGYVSAWDGEKPTGPLLYESGERQVTTQNVATPVTFATGGLPMTTGLSYVAFLSASGLFDGVDDFTNLVLQEDTYPGGGHFALASGNDFSQVFTRPWHGLSPEDLAFRAEVAPIPEPSTVVLLGTGLAAAAAARRKRARGEQVRTSRG
jgi:PEP-CTERM motif